MADNLESYFKKNLSGETPGDDNWNVPSEDVWDKVAPVIQKKRGIFIPWRYFYIIGIIALSLLIFFWVTSSSDSSTELNNELSSNQTEELTQTGAAEPSTAENNENENITKAIPYTKDGDLNPTVETEAIFKNNEDNIEASLISDVEVKSSSEQDPILTDELDPAISGTNSKNSNLGIIALQDQTESESGKTQEGHFTKTDPAEYDDITTMEGKGIEEIENEEFTMQPAAERSVSALPDDIQPSTKSPIDNKGRFAVGAFFAPTWTSTYTKGDPSQGKIETGNMFLYSSNWGFELKYFISNRFTLVTGIEKSEIRSWSKSAMDFGYDSSTEHLMPGGEKENTSPVPMPTPFGKIDTELTYRFPGEDNIPDGDLMISAFETHQELRYLSIPLGVEFNIIRSNRFSWFAETGLRYNRAIKDATTFTSRVIHEGHDMDVVGEEMNSHPTYTENYLNFYLGTGVNYQFSKKLQISGSGRYFGNITKVNLQENLSTYVHGFNFKIGLIYIF